MRTGTIRRWLFHALLVCGGGLFAGGAYAADNSWTNAAATGSWQDATKWSLLAAPTSTHSAVFITNGATKTVTVNSATPSGNLTISNLTVAGPAGTVNTHQITNTPTPLRILNNFTISTGGNLLVGPGGKVRVDVDLTTSGTMTVTNGELVATNASFSTLITGQAIVNGASSTLTLDAFIINGGGTLTLSAGSLILQGPIISRLGTSAGNTGTVWVTGGQLVSTNSSLHLGFATNAVARMTVSNGTFMASDLHVGEVATSQGRLTIAGGTNTVSSDFFIGQIASATGTVFVSGGQLVATNAPMVIGSNGVGQVTQSGGTMLASNVTVGAGAGSQGTLTVAGGTNTLGILRVGGAANSTGTVWLTGGQLVVTNRIGGVVLGSGGVGQMTVSNGTCLANVAVGPFSAGTLTIAGGTNTFTPFFGLGGVAGATGTMWITGGQLATTNSSLIVVLSQNGVGRVTLSNGTWRAQRIDVGNSLDNNAGSQGTLTIAGGTNTVWVEMLIGNFDCSSTGVVNIVGGRLFVTNSAARAVLEVRSGSVILNSGLLTIDKFVMTNSCANFVHTGGTLVYGTAVLDPNRDDDGDGLPNGWEQQYGLDPLDATGDNGASGDPDNDGKTNLQEFQSGSSPTIEIKAITRESNNIRVTWQFPASKTNALQATAGGVGGNYSTNSFADIFTVTNAVGGVTNYLDGGAATNVPARYYRVRLVP